MRNFLIYEFIGRTPSTGGTFRKTLPSSSFPCFFFGGDFLAFFLASNFLAFLSVFPIRRRDKSCCFAFPETARKRRSGWKHPRSFSWNSPRDYGWEPPKPYNSRHVQSVSRILSPSVQLGMPLSFRSDSGKGLLELSVPNNPNRTKTAALQITKCKSQVVLQVSQENR